MYDRYLMLKSLPFVDLLVALIRKPGSFIRNTIGLFAGTIVGSVCRLCICVCLLLCIPIARQALFPKQTEQQRKNPSSVSNKLRRVQNGVVCYCTHCSDTAPGWRHATPRFRWPAAPPRRPRRPRRPPSCWRRPGPQGSPPRSGAPRTRHGDAATRPPPSPGRRRRATATSAIIAPPCRVRCLSTTDGEGEKMAWATGPWDGCRVSTNPIRRPASGFPA